MRLPEVPQSWRFFQPLPTSFSFLTRNVPSQSGSTLLRACNSGFGASLNEPVPAIHAVRRIGVHARRSHQLTDGGVLLMSLISLPAFLMTRPPTSHNKEVVSILGSARPGFAPGQTRSAKCRRSAALLDYRRGPSSMGAYSRRKSAKAAIQAAPAAPITTI